MGRPPEVVALLRYEAEWFRLVARAEFMKEYEARVAERISTSRIHPLAGRDAKLFLVHFQRFRELTVRMGPERVE